MTLVLAIISFVAVSRTVFHVDFFSKLKLEQFAGSIGTTYVAINRKEYSGPEVARITVT